MISFIEATTIQDAWQQAIYKISEEGRLYTIDKGSYEGLQRLEFYPLVVIDIQQPYVKPLAVRVPEGKNIPCPSADEYVQEYLSKLVDPSSKHENEDYVYADYVWPQLPAVIDKLSHGGGTNQATITVGDNKSIELGDPPCLKIVDFRLTKNRILNGLKDEYKLDMIVYFRSWDLWAGFPNNIAALELLREYTIDVLHDEHGMLFTNPESGRIVAVSKGLHLYQYAWDYAEIMNGKPFAWRK